MSEDRLGHGLRRRCRLLALALVTAGVGSACEPPLDVQTELLVTEVTTGWFDAGILSDGKNKLVPTISFQLQNAAENKIHTVQINGVFRRLTEQEEWGNAFVRAIGAEGLDSGSSTPPIILRSTLGYTSTEARLDMLQHRLFLDAKVELFAKHGGAQWVKLGDYTIERQLLTR